VERREWEDRMKGKEGEKVGMRKRYDSGRDRIAKERQNGRKLRSVQVIA
jgi:hypothetical protein